MAAPSSSLNANLFLGKDANGNVGYWLPFTPIGYSTTLAANTAQNLTVPSNVNVAFFTYTAGHDVWVDGVNTAAVPGASFSQTNADLNPVGRHVYPGQTLSFISSDICGVKVSFYTTVNGLL